VLAARTGPKLDAQEPVAGSEPDGTAGQGATGAGPSSYLGERAITDAVLANLAGDDGKYRELARGELAGELRRHGTTGSQGASPLA